ncbi:hypothetical protein HCN44_005724 [Aphidius gifuensis]|uniref:F-box domain-containing protein n=1 Tax=Aphidius gifuensis TaxID=684658 RepID=A0A835CT60_APHGI|nr:hypothetical protein HCN44_005724 [Aphidius gifuensis]
MGNTNSSCLSFIKKYKRMDDYNDINDTTQVWVELHTKKNIYWLDDKWLVKIFKYLDQHDRIVVESVCKRWRELSKNQAWEHEKVAVIMKPPSLNMSRIQELLYTRNILLRCGPHLKKLSITSICDSRILKIVNENCLNLDELSLGLMAYNANDCRGVFSNMKKLRVLEIRNLYEIPDNLFEEIQDISETAATIAFHRGDKEADITDYNLIINFSSPIFEKFNLLCSLTIEDYIVNLNFMKVISKKHNIKILKLINCKFENRYCIELILQLKNLKYLNLMKVSDVDDDFLKSLSNQCQNLVSLCFSYCSNITDQGIVKLSKLNNLYYLDIKMQRGSMLIGDNSIQKFINLKYLDCSGNCAITNYSIEKILLNSPDIENLNVSYTSITFELISSAANLTRKRLNNIKLYILVSFISQSVEDILKEPKYKSPFLVVTKLNHNNQINF